MRRFVLTTLLLIVPFFLTGCGFKKTAAPTSTTKRTGTTSLATAIPDTNAASAKIGTGSANSTNLGSTYLTIDPTTVDSAIQANYQQAVQKVKAWKSDAVLYQVSAKLPTNLAVGQVTEVYTFGSPTDAYNWWTLNVSQKTGKSVRAIIPKEDYLGTTLQPIPLKFWKMNYVEALQLAEVNGGSDFRSGHNDAQVTIDLSVTQPKNFLWWTVQYDSATAEPYKILINPSTKEVFDENGKSLSGAPTVTKSVASPKTTAITSPVSRISPAASPVTSAKTSPAIPAIDESSSLANTSALQE